MSGVLVSEIADALFTQISMPPKWLMVSSTASLTLTSSRTSRMIGNASPPAATISSAAVYIVPGSFG